MSHQTLILLIFGAMLSLTGLAGTLLPFLPGAPLLFVGLLLCAWAENFQYVGIGTLMVLAAMAALTWLVEFLASVLGVKKFGGSRRAMLGAALGGVVGMFLGPAGILLGPFVGAVLGEMSLDRSLDRAGRAGFGTVVGLAIGVAGKLAIAIAMLGLFLLVRLY
ncbi:DUF456 domain-containing protein [Pelobacter propionicus]|uniref:DUF456 domain-containing protein n=1 Tax=Pelobacter propionicus (strain DSM 2379 / NBRC 103807 / OttBd1) TaxID=338966 RepID=A1APY5_PELPD|nr:DUF456 domain-containing protein [Pelobacter propionicus]ABK99405.1 protein of unknown function DUF456 [Pelobacter propionicus DSM 2379]